MNKPSPLKGFVIILLSAGEANGLTAAAVDVFEGSIDPENRRGIESSSHTSTAAAVKPFASPADNRIMTKPFKGSVCFIVLALFASGCAAGKAFRQGESAMHDGNLDEAVAAYRRPCKPRLTTPNYKIALQRASVAASRAHLERRANTNSRTSWRPALGEYKASSEYDRATGSRPRRLPSWIARFAIRRVEASRPKPPILALRERARAASAERFSTRVARAAHLPVHEREPSRLLAIGAPPAATSATDRDVADFARRAWRSTT